MSETIFKVGDRVRFTATFLRNTGATDGRWTVVACKCGLCQRGRGYIAVDEASDTDSGLRHMASSNMEKAP